MEMHKKLFFQSKKIETQFLSLIAPCPILFLLTVATASLNVNLITFPITIVGFTILFSIWRFKEKALVIGLIAHLFLFLFFYNDIPEHLRFTEIGFSLVFCVNYLIALLSRLEVDALFVQLSQQEQENQNNFLVLKEQIKEAQDAFEKQKEALHAEIKRLQEEAKQRIIEKIMSEQPLEQAHALTVMESTIENTQPILALDRASELVRVQAQYRQLKQQFEEKSNVLSQTRKELFHLEGKLLARNREDVEKQRDMDLTEIKGLQKDLNTQIQENESLEKEITSLEELIFHILSH